MHYCVTLIGDKYTIEEIDIPKEIIYSYQFNPFNYVLGRIKGTMIGFFGREDFANIWKDFYNGEITREQMNILFDKIRK